MTPKISLVAWEARFANEGPRFIFVAVPDEKGRYVRTDACVAYVACHYCHATVGEPCRSGGRYFAGTHVDRRTHFTNRRKRGEFGDAEKFDVAKFHTENPVDG